MSAARELDGSHEPFGSSASTTTVFDSFWPTPSFASTEAALEYLPVAVSLCSQVHVADSPAASELLPPATLVQLASLKLLSASVVSPVSLASTSYWTVSPTFAGSSDFVKLPVVPMR